MEEDWYMLLHKFCTSEHIVKNANISKTFKYAYELGAKESREAAQRAAINIFNKQFWSEFK